MSDRPVEFQNCGRIYLIELRRPFMTKSGPIGLGYIPDDSG
jgi:hypothetical protein